MRAFIGLRLPDSAKNKISEIQDTLMKKEFFIGKFTEFDNIHLTLKFLGDIEENTLKLTRELLRGLNYKPFRAKINQAGVFSDPLIRIIWVNILNVDKLQSLIDESLDGLFLKERRFMGHITLARVKKVKRQQPLLDHLKQIELDLDVPIDSFYLMESILTKEGPNYRVIEEYKL